MSRPDVSIRPRRPEDIPLLAEVLLAQQAETRYPVRDPLPIPVEQFLHAEDAMAAWTAEVDGHPRGHVCRTGPVHDFLDAPAMNEACTRAHGCDVDRLGWVSTLFVGRDTRGLGLGRRLLTAVVADIRSVGLLPCLEVLPMHAAALSLYVATGWRTVAEVRPAWLRSAVGEAGPDVQVMVLDT